MDIGEHYAILCEYSHIWNYDNLLDSYVFGAYIEYILRLARAYLLPTHICYQRIETWRPFTNTD